MATLEQTKNTLKQSLVKDMAEGIEAFLEVLSTHSRRYNELLLQVGRFNQIKSEIRTGIIEPEDARIVKAQIAHALHSQIDELEEKDLKVQPIRDPTLLDGINELEREGLNAQLELLVKKRNRIQEALAIENDPSRQFQYETQIERLNKQIAELKNQIGG